MPTSKTPSTDAGASRVERYFTEASAQYSELFLARRRGKNFEFRQRLTLASEMSAVASGSLLDCSAGSGEITAAILKSNRFNRATLVDLSPRMLESARRQIETAYGLETLIQFEFVRSDIFKFALENSSRRFNLILCLGLIAHTGQLADLLSALKRMLADDGAVLLQSTLSDHIGVRLVRALAESRYYRRHGYKRFYFRHRDIVGAAGQAGLAIEACSRFVVGFPFGDRIWARGNYYLEAAFQTWAKSYGAEAIYLLKQERAIG